MGALFSAEKAGEKACGCPSGTPENNHRCQLCERDMRGYQNCEDCKAMFYNLRCKRLYCGDCELKRDVREYRARATQDAIRTEEVD